MKPPRFFRLCTIGLFLIIVLLPFFYMVGSCFWAGGPVGTQDGVSLFDVRQLALARNSLLLASGATALSLLIGAPIAFLLCKTDMAGAKLLGLLSIVPILIPPYIHAIVWAHLHGAVKSLMGFDIHSLLGAIIVLGLAYYPFVILLTSSGLKSIDRNIEEVSFLCCGRWKTLRSITGPLVIPHMLTGAVFVFIFSLVDFGVPDILRVKVYPVEIFVQFSAFYDERAATILSLPVIGIAVLLLLVQKWIMKDRSYVQLSSGFQEIVKYELGRRRLPALGFLALVLSLSVFLPLGVLLEKAGGFSSYARVLGSSMEQITYSLMLASTGAAMTVMLGFSVSYLISRSSGKTRAPLSLATFIPLTVPAITLGIGLIKVWNRPFLDCIYDSCIIILFGYIARFIPFSAITLNSGLQQVSPRLEEAAFLVSSRWCRVIRVVVLPLMRNSLLAGFFIVFILSFGELGSTLLVIPPGRETIPIKIFNLMHYGADRMVAALCIILILMMLGFSGLYLLVRRKMAESY